MEVHSSFQTDWRSSKIRTFTIIISYNRVTDENLYGQIICTNIKLAENQREYDFMKLLNVTKFLDSSIYLHKIHLGAQNTQYGGCFKMLRKSYEP